MKRGIYFLEFFFSKIKHIFFEKSRSRFFYRKPHDLSYICNDKNFKLKTLIIYMVIFRMKNIFIKI